MTGRSHRMSGDRGSIAVEVAVVAPAFVFLLLLVVYAGHSSEADAVVTRSASEAARAASLRQRPTDATADAEVVARENLATAGISCDPLDVEVDSADLQPGGRVAVTVTCTATTANIALIGVPATRIYTARSVEVVDRYRGVDS